MTDVKVEKNSFEQQLGTWFAEGQYSAIANFVLRKELNDDKITEELLSLHLVALLLDNDTVNARFLWKRLTNSQKDPMKEFKALWKVAQSLWQRDYPKFYTAIDDFAWSKRIKPFVEALKATTQERMRQLIGEAYNSLSIGACSQMLGMNPEKTIKYIVDFGWRYDQNQNTVYPTKPVVTKARDVSVRTLEQLTDFAINLS